MKSLFFFISFLILPSNIDVATIRMAYQDAVVSKTKAFLLYEKLEIVTKNDGATIIAYKGAVAVLTSKYLKNAKAKKERLANGVALIQYAVKKQPNNIEIRFIRMTLQQNIPKFLKYRKDLDADKTFILSEYKQIRSKVLKKIICDYFLQSNFFTKAEKNVISQP